MKTPYCKLRLCLAIVIGIMLTIAGTQAATIAVTNTNNGLAGSLRQAIQDAAPGDTIIFQIPTTDPGYGGGVFTITLTDAELTIGKNLTIDGGDGKILVQRSGAGGTPNFRIFDVTSGVVTLSRLTIAHGDVSSDADPRGGGIKNSSTLAITNCLLLANAAGEGGAVYNAAGATLVATNCTTAGNVASGGSGVFNNGGTLTLTSTTVTLNTSSSHFSDGVAVFKSSGNGGSAHIHNSVIAGNSSASSGGPDVTGTFISDGFNFIGVQDANASGFGASGSHDQVGSLATPGNPILGPLQDNGGPTLTVGPKVGSPLIDQGDSGGLTNDQRGQPRPVDQPGVANSGDGSDIGAVEVGPPQAGPTFTVTTISEHNDGICSTDDCTLLDALSAANANADASIINFAPGVTGTVETNLTPQGLPISNPVTINGPGARLLSINARQSRRIFKISGSQQVSISGLSLINGKAGGSAFPDNVGGAILNTASLTLTDCTLSGNSATSSGGCIYNNGASGNATLTLVRCTLSGNSASSAGGGILNAGYGGHATVNLTNCTLDQNSAPYGGAIYNDGTSSGNAALTLTNCTLNKNSAGTLAGGIYSDALNPGSSGIATVILRNTILRAGSSGVNLYNDSAVGGGGAITSQGNSLSSDAAGGPAGTGPGGFLNAAGDKRNTDPKLDILGNNGGPTDTCALLSNSPAIDMGNDANAPGADQRGFSRVGVSDIGAFEFNGVPPAIHALSAVSRKTQGGSGTFDISLPLTGSAGIECRTGGAGGNHQVIVTFASAVSVAGLSVMSTDGLATATRSVSGAIVTVELSAVANAQTLGITLTNVSDGTNAGDVFVPMGVLLGDTTGNGSVNATDVSLTKLKSGQPVDASNFREDVTVNGSINASDVSSVKLKSGTALP